MWSISRLLLASLAVVCWLLPAESHAFEINGLHSGMSQEEALQVLQKRAKRVVRVQDQPEHKPTFLATRSDSGMSEAATFCRSYLYSYQYDVVGGFPAFTRLVEKETLKRGAGRYEARATETPIGEWNSIKVIWTEGRDVFEIGYSVVRNGDQVYVRYEQDSQCI